MMDMEERLVQQWRGLVLSSVHDKRERHLGAKPPSEEKAGVSHDDGNDEEEFQDLFEMEFSESEQNEIDMQRILEKIVREKSACFCGSAGWLVCRMPSRQTTTQARIRKYRIHPQYTHTRSVFEMGLSESGQNEMDM